MTAAEDKLAAIADAFADDDGSDSIGWYIDQQDKTRLRVQDIRDLRDLLAQRQWRPIESAPRDGTDVLVGRDHATVWIVHVAWYRDGSPESGADGPEDIGWWSYVRHSVTQEKLEGLDEPTHWMPLPEPPT